tara:strand:+ start:5351 stop:7012 length:1662 start_codon:yes stop_codon:yes gene_type:complete
LVVPLFEIKLSKKPIAIIKMGDRNITFVKINKYNSKYFTTKEGQTYELDDEYEYRFKKTGIYFYNFSNSKPVSLSALNEIDSVMKDSGESELFNKDRFMQSVGNDPSIDVATLNIPKDIAGDMTSDTKRFLQDHATDDETSKTDMMINVHTQSKPIPRYSSQLLGMGMNRTGYAFVQIGYQRLDIVPMYVNNNRAYTSFGVFEIDKDNVYFLKKQMLCFFIVSNEREELSPPMEKPAYKAMKNMIKKKRWNNLESFIKPISKDNDSDLEGVKKKAIPKSVSISSEKKLVQFQADSPSVCYTTMKELHLTKEAVAKQLSDPFKKAIPIMLVFGAVMGIAVVMSNAPPVIDAVADRVVGKPDVFVMTPEEYEQWEIDNGLRDEADRRFVAGLGEDEYQAYLDAGGTPYNPEAETFLGVKVNESPAEQVASQEARDNLTDEEIDSMAPMIDDVAPELMAPILRTYESDNTNGMKVKFNVIVLDNVDDGLVAECDPNSGAILAIGEHDVLCRAIDSSGNIGEVRFTLEVTVREGTEPTSLIPKIQPMPPMGMPSLTP